MWDNIHLREGRKHGVLIVCMFPFCSFPFWVEIVFLFFSRIDFSAKSLFRSVFYLDCHSTCWLRNVSPSTKSQIKHARLIHYSPCNHERTPQY